MNDGLITLLRKFGIKAAEQMLSGLCLYTAPISGIYQVSFNVHASTALTIRVNGMVVQRVAAATPQVLSINFVHKFNAGDRVTAHPSAPPSGPVGFANMSIYQL